MVTETKIPARDGFELAATLYEPADGDTRRVVIINSATAVGRGFYRRFAQFLTDNGFAVVTYDYRGIGESKPDSLRGFEAAMRHWAELDMAGVADWAHRHYAPERLFVIGHSVGGQLMGLLDNSHLVHGMLCTSAQSGYWGVQGGSQKQFVWLSMHVVVPTLTPLVGYFPWTLFGANEDLPKGVALEWAKWCRSPRYVLNDEALESLENFASFTAPIVAYSFADDDWGTARAVDDMMAGYTGSPIERRHVAPADVGMRSIGHFGFYREGAETLWREVVDWLNGLDSRHENIR